LSNGSPVATYQAAVASSIDDHVDRRGGDLGGRALVEAQRDARVHVVATARHRGEHRAGLRGVGRLAEDGAVDVDGGVGRDHERARVDRHGGRLLAAEAGHVGDRILAVEDGLVDVGGAHREHDPELVEQFAAARRTRRQDDRHVSHH
jgi:hypothetical protein